MACGRVGVGGGRRNNVPGLQRGTRIRQTTVGEGEYTYMDARTAGGGLDWITLIRVREGVEVDRYISSP